VLPIFVFAAVVHDGVLHDTAVEKELEVSVGDRVDLRVPRDVPGATYRLDGLPLDAAATATPDGVAVHWTPRDADVGSYDVTIDVRGAAGEDKRRVHVVVDERGHQLLVPGAVASLFVPDDLEHLGAFVGGGLELVIYSFADQGSLFVPSHGRFYLDLFALPSTHANVDPLFSASLGFDLTLERSPGRRYLLPFVGAQVGVSYQKQAGPFGWGMPLVGLYPWASHTVRVAVEGGYLLPTTAAQDVRGVVVLATIDLAPW